MRKGVLYGIWRELVVLQYIRRDSMETENKQRRLDPKKEAAYYVKDDEDPPGFDMKIFPWKGRGVVSNCARRRGNFPLHYTGEMISAEDGEMKEEKGSSGYRFFYRGLCVDASKETGRLGRLVNQGRRKEQNAVVKETDGNLLSFCIRDFEIREEILCDYGLKHLVWEKTAIPLKNVLVTPEADSTSDKTKKKIPSTCITDKSTEEFQEYVLNRLPSDDVSHAIKSDPLILLLGQTEFSELGTARAALVRENLRIISRLKICLQSNTGNASACIEDFITSDKYGTCLSVVRTLASSSGTETFSKLSLALKAGQLLKKVAELKKRQAVRRRDLDTKTDVSDFIYRYDAEFIHTLSSLAHKTLPEQKIQQKRCSSTHSRSHQANSKFTKRNRTRWTEKERQAVKKYLVPNVHLYGKPPTKPEIKVAQILAPELSHRFWKIIKYQAWAMYNYEIKRIFLQ